ncbi:MAG: alpha/beta fold hydrolase [Mariprofundaceae bacterium]
MIQHHHEKLFIDGPVGLLQALYQPGEAGKPAIVVCHPHPQFGGTMRNKVVYWMGRAFEDLGCSVLRFNFRGVEKSDGVWDEGCGEADDVAAALDWLHEQHPTSPLWMAGFSFGCFSGLQAARKDSRVERMFAVSPAVNLWDFSFMEGENRPVTVVQGMADEIVPCESVREWSKAHDFIIFCEIENAGHFYPQHMEEMQEKLLSGITIS